MKTWDEWLAAHPAPHLDDATRPAGAMDPVAALVTRASGKSAGAPSAAAPAAECEKPHVLPVGAEAVPGKRGVYRVYVVGDGDAPF